ncbi:MAG: tRNA lysidine(34) synthetase TilS [Balneolaceae bacterium]
MSKSESSRIIRRVENYLRDYFPAGRRSMILGVSGGPDSMSLMYVFSKLEVDLTVVHCNYQLRGDDSDDDQKLVEDTASMWGFDTFSARLDLPAEENRNFQNWARDRRYGIFRDMEKETGADAIVTAHHQDDQLETIIQKILRGSGLTAWQGMKIWNGELFRPLLDFRKAELLQFASANHVPYRLDGSNEESTYARNFLRNGWFPILDDLFPGWRENILKVPDRAREHEALVKNLIRSLKLDDRSIHRTRLLSLSPDVQKPLILHVLKSVDPDIPVSSGALENLDNLTGLQTGKKLAVNARWSLVRDRDRFIIHEETRHTAEETEISKEELGKARTLQDFRLEISEWDGRIDTGRLQLDADRLDWPLKLRSWKDGDTVNPLGMDGTQKVSDHLTNEKIPATGKLSAKVAVTSDDRICAVLFPGGVKDDRPGTIAHWARCTDATTRALLISRAGETDLSDE